LKDPQFGNLCAFFNFWEYTVRDEGRLSRRYETEPAAFADISYTRLVNLAREKIIRTKEKNQNGTALFFSLEVQGLDLFFSISNTSSPSTSSVNVCSIFLQDK